MWSKVSCKPFIFLNSFLILVQFLLNLIELNPPTVPNNAKAPIAAGIAPAL